MTFIIGFAILDEPVSFLMQTLSNSYPDSFESHDTVVSTMSWLPTIFISAFVAGIVGIIVWYIAFSYKYEYERGVYEE